MKKSKAKIDIVNYNNETKAFENKFFEEDSHILFNYVLKTKKIEIGINKAGCISLARLFMSIAESDIPDVFDWHTFCELESGKDIHENSANIIVTKIK